uniref:ATP-dependent RNA helicase TDRD9 n=1 Tax=Sphenodon punctatus TaxID=8508 RepID=A0A8D0GJ38_SPHPU
YKYPDLPISRCRQELTSLIEYNSVVIVRGATGSGKSTQLPQYILDYYTEHSTYCNIVVTQPRKIGASSIAKWISRERSWSLGGLVGYQVGLEKVVTKDTRLVYMTTGVLLQKIVGAKSLTEFTHIFIDEVHERTDEMDFLLLVVRKLLRTNSRFVKVILMSATINCKEFSDYFAVPVRNKLYPAYVFEVEGKPHAIEEYYLNDLKHLSAPLFEEPMITKEMYEVAVSLIQLFDELDLKEISLICCRRLQVYALHSTITLEEQSNVFLTPVPGYRKIILSTNIAESSVTVPDVKYVIDFCLTRTLVCDEDTNYQSLRLNWASKTSCNQRRGRAGRVSKGYCYRLVYKDFWTNFIPENAIPEMLRCPLGSTVLKAKLLNMGEPRALLATALTPPSIEDIERTVLQLKEVGALAISADAEEENPHDGELTFLGRVLAQLPVDQQIGKLIVLGHVFGCLEECLIIAAALSSKNFFVMPFRQHLDGYRNKVYFSGNRKSDCIALVDAFKVTAPFKMLLEQIRLPEGKFSKRKAVAELLEELKNRIQKFNMYVDSQPPVMDREYIYKQRFILQVVMTGAFYPNYFTFGQCDEEVAVRELDGNDPKTTVVLKNIPPYGFLYYKQLQSLFRQCGQVKSISYEQSKAYVTFSRNPTERFKTLPAVSMALKMSHLRVPLELHVHSPEKIEEKMEGRMVPTLRSTRYYNNKSSAEISKEIGHFWGYRIDEKNTAVLKGLTAEINQLDLMPLSIRPHPDLVCLAPFSDLQNNRYYRAQILSVPGDSAEVFFVDYGNRSRVALDELRKIPSHLQELPFQVTVVLGISCLKNKCALEFKLCKMRPSAKSLVCGEQWSYEASQRFASLVNRCALTVKVYSLVHSVLHVDVYRYSGIKEVVNIRDILVNEGYAELAEESCESNVGIAISFSMLDLLIVLLHGPFNPYELKLCSMTRISRFRCVAIERDSIHSVLVSDAPEDPFQQMLVAASLSVNANGSTMLLRETSLMPRIPGLPALLSMLFAPVIELRVDKHGRSYTGVLCGLGWHRSLGTPVLPEHDMELAFDVQFDVNDIVEINILRTAINKLVCDGPNGSVHLGQERTAQLQEDARQKLLGPKPREVISPKWHAKPYEWNQVRLLSGAVASADLL